MYPALLCPLFGCFSNVVWWSSRCCPPGRWKRNGTDFHSRQWLHKDPCGLICATMTHFFICGAGYIVNAIIIFPWFGFSLTGILLSVVDCTLLLLAALCHFKAMTTNPGAVPKNAVPLEPHLTEITKSGKSIPKCNRTGIYKPPRAHFDRQIGRQVVKMDHHCPWVNNCVGIGNQKFFILFCVYICLSCIFSFLMLCGLWVKCGAKVSQNEPVCIGAKLPGNMVLLMLLCMEALLFALFTMCMSCDQFSSVYSNKTYIDHLQARQRGKSFKSSKEKGSLLKNIREVVGDTRYTLMWFLPIKPYWKDWQKIVWI